MSFVRLSVTLVDHDHIDWKSWKLIAWTVVPSSSLFVAQKLSTYSQGNMEKFWRENIHSTPTSIMSGWIESTESRDISWRFLCLFLFVYFCRHITRSSLRLHSFLVIFTEYRCAFVVIVNNPGMFAGELNAKWSMMRFVESTVRTFRWSGHIFFTVRCTVHCNSPKTSTVYFREYVNDTS